LIGRLFAPLGRRIWWLITHQECAESLARPVWPCPTLPGTTEFFSLLV
jgi:hypothetical protein